MLAVLSHSTMTLELNLIIINTETTFMNVLMGKVSRTQGKLFINNSESEMSKYKKIIGYVPQEDIMLREMTVRENIEHSARIRLPSSWSRKEVTEFVDGVLEVLNLSHVQNVLIGDESTRGVSGGQRKRVNIGMELAAIPLALFLDEPTSGLDSTAALKVAEILKRIAGLGLTVVSVIHQPRFEIFQQFDEILMIAPGGRTAYLGPTAWAIDYFEGYGFYVSESLFSSITNPSIIFLHANELIVICGFFSSSTHARTLLIS
jgi:ABC-type multidrug transport system ATPase subunit